MAVASWTDDMVEELRRLWAAGYSATEIAHELGGGISRCAVIGKVNRLGLERRRPTHPRKPRAKTKARGRPIKRRPMFISPPPVPEPLPAPPQEPAAPKPRRLTLLQLADHHCRWPVEDNPFRFCGAYRQSGDPYCRYHLAKAFVKPRGR